MSNSISTLVQTGLAKYDKSALIHICKHNVVYIYKHGNSPRHPGIITTHYTDTAVLCIALMRRNITHLSRHETGQNFNYVMHKV